MSKRKTKSFTIGYCARCGEMFERTCDDLLLTDMDKIFINKIPSKSIEIRTTSQWRALMTEYCDYCMPLMPDHIRAMLDQESEKKGG